MARSNIRQYLRFQRQIKRAKELGYTIPTKNKESVIIPDEKKLVESISKGDIGYIIYGSK